MNAEEFASRLERARKNGKGWEACCPAHEDRHASLSVRDGDKGVLVKCFGGCTTEEVVKRMGLSMRDLFHDDGRGNGQGWAQPAPAKAPPGLSPARVEQMAAALQADTQAWAHVTEELRLDPEVLRAEKVGLSRFENGIRWLAYPYKHAGVWRFANCRSIDGPRRFRREPQGQPTTLYRGDTLEDGGTAILVEGEKDALAALTLGLAGELGGPGGAAVVGIPGANQVRLAVEALRSQRRVYVATDADPAGDKAAAEIMAGLGPRAVRLRPPAKDFGELLAQHGAQAALAQVLEVARRAEEDTGSSHDRLERMARGEYEPAPLVPTGLHALDKILLGGLPLNKLTVIAARTAHGKSATAVRLAVNMTLAGRVVRVLWCEDDQVEFDLRSLAVLSGTAFPAVLDAYRAKALGSIWQRVPGPKRDAWRKHCRTYVPERPTPEWIAELLATESGAVFLLDHLGEVNWGEGRKHELIGDGLRLIRGAALRHRNLFIGMTQLNREWDRRKAAAENPEDVRPALSDIENSGQIEQVARVCIIAEKVLLDGKEGGDGEYHYHLFKPRVASASCRWHDALATPDNHGPCPVGPRGGELEERLVEAFGQIQEAATVAELSDRVARPVAEVNQCLRRLVASGRATSRAGPDGVWRWWPVAAGRAAP